MFDVWTCQKFVACLNRLSQDMHELYETLRVKTSILEGERAVSTQFMDSLPKVIPQNHLYFTVNTAQKSHI